MTEYINTSQLAAFFPDATTLPYTGRAKLWDVLRQLTVGTVESNHSDLYHDAGAIHRWGGDGKLKDGTVLIYGTRTHGTHLQLDDGSGTELAEEYSDKVYTVQLKNVRGRWQAEVYRIK